MNKLKNQAAAMTEAYNLVNEVLPSAKEFCLSAQLTRNAGGQLNKRSRDKLRQFNACSENRIRLSHSGSSMVLEVQVRYDVIPLSCNYMDYAIYVYCLDSCRIIKNDSNIPVAATEDDLIQALKELDCKQEEERSIYGDICRLKRFLGR